MTKSVKHKKEFRKEKNKIKLKLSAQSKNVGKATGKNKKGKKGGLLPKGLNVTDTSFKTRKIVLPDNLRPEGEENAPLTRKKQTFKELFSHMNHHNSSVQLDGVNGMREILSNNPDVLETNLAQLIRKLPELFICRESSVRKPAMKLLELVIQMVGVDRIAPFFPLLVAQLLCMMNHIQLDIQQDSHVLLDILIANVPSLVASDALKIVGNFLEQISCRGDSTAGKRVLTINPTQRLTSLKWRQEVLTRICKLLELISTSRSESSTPAQNHAISEKDRGLIYCPLYSPRYSNLKLNITPPGVSVGQSREVNEIQETIASLFPLLTETWVEAIAGEQLNKSNEEGSLIGPDTAALLSCICRVMAVLWSILTASDNVNDSRAWFQQQFGDQLTRHLIQRFPFSCRPNGRKSNVSRIDAECRTQNLILAFFWAQMSLRSSPKYAKIIFPYVNRLLNSAVERPLATSETEQIQEILRVTSAKKSYHKDVDAVIETITQLIQRIRTDRKDRLALCHLLIDMGLAVDLEKFPILNEWFQSCPKLLGETSSLSLMCSINRAVSRFTPMVSHGRPLLRNLISQCPVELWRPLMDFVYWNACDWDQKESVVGLLRKELDRLDDPMRIYTEGLIRILS